MVLKLFIIFVFISYCSAVYCFSLVSRMTYTAEEIFEYINQLIIDTEMKSLLIDEIIARMESYVFKDIAKNPPLFGNEIKLDVVDINKYLDSLRMKEHESFYDFMSDLNKLGVNLHDGHLQFIVNENGLLYNKLSEIYVVYPFKFSLKNDTLYLLNYVSSDKFDHLIIHQQEIESINGQQPLDYLMSLGSKISFFKNPHSVLTYVLYLTEYAWSMKSLSLEREYLMKEISIKINGNPTLIIGNFKFYYESKQAKMNYIQNFTSNKEQMSYSGINYIEFSDNVECFIDYSIKLNTIIYRSFGSLEAMDEFNYCLDEFSKNTYPIQIIFDKNFGGFAICSQEAETGITFNDDVNYLGDVICNEESKCTLITTNSFTGIDDCIPLKNYFVNENMKYINKCREIKFGNVSHIVTQLMKVLGGYQTNSSFKRLPNEVFIYTDALCFSACALFTKGIKEHGSGIIIGFMGHPNIKGTKLFDVGSSPTSVVDDEICINYKKNKLCILSMTKSDFETYRFNYNYNETIPREYILDEIDERFNFYEFYSNENYHHFANYTMSLYKKYKYECNSKNKRLILYSSDCDEELSKIDQHLHGGYLCNDEGYWSTTCVGGYCDIGYKFDRDNMKCKKDICYPNHKKTELIRKIYLFEMN